MNKRYIIKKSEDEDKVSLNPDVSKEEEDEAMMILLFQKSLKQSLEGGVTKSVKKKTNNTNKEEEKSAETNLDGHLVLKLNAASDGKSCTTLAASGTADPFAKSINSNDIVNSVCVLKIYYEIAKKYNSKSFEVINEITQVILASITKGNVEVDNKQFTAQITSKGADKDATLKIWSGNITDLSKEPSYEKTVKWNKQVSSERKKYNDQ